MQTKGTEDIAAFSSREVKRTPAEVEEGERIFICRKVMSVESGKKIIPTSAFKTLKGNAHWDGKEKEGQ